MPGAPKFRVSLHIMVATVIAFGMDGEQPVEAGDLTHRGEQFVILQAGEFINPAG